MYFYSRALDREIKKVEAASQKSKKECEKYAKVLASLRANQRACISLPFLVNLQAGRVDAAKIIAKEIVHARKTKERLLTGRAQLNSVPAPSSLRVPNGSFLNFPSLSEPPPERKTNILSLSLSLAATCSCLGLHATSDAGGHGPAPASP